MNKKLPDARLSVTILRPMFFVLLVTLFTFPQVLVAGSDVRDDPQFQRGKKIYDRYCAKCHGKDADGEGRMASLYRKLHAQKPSNFTTGIYIDRPDEYLRLIIVEGGEVHSMSKYMPPFGQEIDKGGVDDLIYFIKIIPELHGLNRNKDSSESIKP